MTNGLIKEEDITIINIYSPNIGIPQYTRQTLTDIKGEIDSNTIIVGDFNIPLTPMDRSSKQKINKETSGTLIRKQHVRPDRLNRHLQNLHTKATEYTLLSSAHGAFSKIGNILRQKTNLDKFERIFFIPFDFFFGFVYVVESHAICHIPGKRRDDSY